MSLRIKGSASQDFGWDGLTLHPNNLLIALPAKLANQRSPSAQADTEIWNSVVSCPRYDPGMIQRDSV